MDHTPQPSSSEISKLEYGHLKGDRMEFFSRFLGRFYVCSAAASLAS